MRKAQCGLPEGGSINMRIGDQHREIIGGDVVDLDEVLVPATPATDDEPAIPAYTLEHALGEHARHFDPSSAEAAEEPQKATRQPRRPKPNPDAELGADDRA